MDLITIGVLLFLWALWSVLWWGSIRLLDRYNAHNTFVLALGLGFIRALLAIVAGGFIGYGISAAYCVLLFRILVQHYELDLGRSIVITIASFLLPYFVGIWLLELVGDNETMVYALLYGLPIVTMGVWWRYASTHAIQRDDNEPIPKARAWKRKGAAGSAPVAASSSAPVAASSSAPVAASSSAPVVASSSAPVVAPVATRDAPSQPVPIVPTRATTAPIVPTRAATAPIVPARAATAPIIPTRTATAPIIPTRAATAPIAPSPRAADDTTEPTTDGPKFLR